MFEASMDSVKGLSNLRKLALGVVVVFYSVGGYGVSDFFFGSGLVAWQVVLVLLVWTGAFGVLGWLIFNAGTSQ